MIDFDAIANFTLIREGGLVDHPRDPGGRTNFGVTQRRLNAARETHPEWNLPAIVDHLTPLQAKMIYRFGEWADIRGDDLPGELALLVFEHAVNAGSDNAIRLLQRALRVRQDGVFGPVTLSAANRAPVREICEEYSAQRAAFYASLDELDDHFGLGWMRRLLRAYTLSIGGNCT